MAVNVWDLLLSRPNNFLLFYVEVLSEVSVYDIRLINSYVLQM